MALKKKPAAKRRALELPLRRFFESPTIGELSKILDKLDGGTPREPAPIRRRTERTTAQALLAKLDTLSERQIEELLEKPDLKRTT